MPSPYSIHEDNNNDNVKKDHNKSRKRRSSSIDRKIKSKRSRRATTEMDDARKHAKILEFLGIRPDTPLALRLSRYDRAEASPAPSTSSDFISRSHNYSPTESNHSSMPIQDMMKDLYRLHILLHNPEQAKGTGSSRYTQPIDGNPQKIYKDEYVVKRIEAMNVFSENNKVNPLQPCFHVTWVGYTDRTWEPWQNVYDCAAFTEYMDQQMIKYRYELDDLWTELTANHADEALPPMTDPSTIAAIAKFKYFQLQSDLIALILCRKNIKKMEMEAAAVQSRCESTLRLLPYLLKRFEQLRQIFIWQIYINKCDKSSNLRVENNVDFEVPPDDFAYTNDVFQGEGVYIPNEPPIGCECTGEGGCNKKSQCCGVSADSKFAYNKNRSICVPQGTPIFECNKTCKCGPECMNRVVQQGRKHLLSIFKTSNGRGWGVRTDKAIAKGQFVCEYVGEVITYEETERRGKIYDAAGRTYLFDLDFNGSDNPYSIDAAKSGNVSHFINHSCDPNLGVWAVWTDCLDRDLPKIGLFTLRNIGEGEEITFDYTNQNKNCDRDMVSAPEFSPVKKSAEAAADDRDGATVAKETKEDVSQSSGERLNTTIEISSDDEENEGTPQKAKFLSEPTECKCGATNCRKFLF